MKKIRFGKEIRISDKKQMSHITISVGVCLGMGITDYEYMLRKADECAEVVKDKGRDSIRIWFEAREHQKMYSDFNDIYK